MHAAEGILLQCDSGFERSGQCHDEKEKNAACNPIRYSPVALNLVSQLCLNNVPRLSLERKMAEVVTSRRIAGQAIARTLCHAPR